MSRLRTLAFAIQERLETIPELAGKIVVWSKDIESDFKQRMNTAAGTCVVIRSVSAKNESQSKASFYSGIFTVTLIVEPILTARDAKGSDDLIADIDAKLHGWWPESITSNTAVYLKCESIITSEGTTNDAKSYSYTVLTLRSPKMSLQS